jgi:hypothetical protein
MIVPRRGVVLLEIIAAFGLMAVLVAVCLQMLSVTALARRAVERRAVALQEATNLLERVSTLPWSDITAERLSKFDVAPSVREILPGVAARLAVEATGDAGPPAKQIRVEITWSNAAGDTDAPLCLCAWTYAPATEAAR